MLKRGGAVILGYGHTLALRWPVNGGLVEGVVSVDNVPAEIAEAKEAAEVAEIAESAPGGKLRDIIGGGGCSVGVKGTRNVRSVAGRHLLAA